MRIRLLFLATSSVFLFACVAELGGTEAKDEEYAEQLESAREPLTTTERRFMLFEGSCHFLACCSKRNCSLPDNRVVGACGTGCSDSTPWIARPNRDRRYSCGECVRVCLDGTSNCVNATVWDNSITRSSIEGNVALFDRLGLAYTESSRACSGTGGAWVTVGPCTAPDPPADPPDAGTDPDPPAPAECSCAESCGYCWCDTGRENNCPESWRGARDGCDCGCQFVDPDCGSATDPGTSTGGTFAGVYCTHPGHGCGGNSPCWPASDCPTGSTCDWASGSWGRCME